MKETQPFQEELICPEIVTLQLKDNFHVNVKLLLKIVNNWKKNLDFQFQYMYYYKP